MVWNDLVSLDIYKDVYFGCIGIVCFFIVYFKICLIGVVQVCFLDFELLINDYVI